MKRKTALTKEERREYQRNWYQKNKAKKRQPQLVPETVNPLMPIIGAYQTLYSNTSNGETKSQLNKAFASIIIELS